MHYRILLSVLQVGLICGVGIGLGSDVEDKKPCTLVKSFYEETRGRGSLLAIKIERIFGLPFTTDEDSIPWFLIYAGIESCNSTSLTDTFGGQVYGARSVRSVWANTPGMDIRNFMPNGTFIVNEYYEYTNCEDGSSEGPPEPIHVPSLVLGTLADGICRTRGGVTARYSCKPDGTPSTEICKDLECRSCVDEYANARTISLDRSKCEVLYTPALENDDLPPKSVKTTCRTFNSLPLSA